MPTQHTLVTGHSGAGKSTLARSFGLPIHALDDDPDIHAQLQRQKEYASRNGGRLPSLDNPEYNKAMQRAERRAIGRALALADPHVVEGAYLLNRRPAGLRAHKLHLVDVPQDVVLAQRVERERQKDLAKGRTWSDERAAGVRMRGQQLIDEYEPGAARWRASPYVTKHRRHDMDKTSEHTAAQEWERGGHRRLDGDTPQGTVTRYRTALRTLPHTERSKFTEMWKQRHSVIPTAAWARAEMRELARLEKLERGEKTASAVPAAMLSPAARRITRVAIPSRTLHDFAHQGEQIASAGIHADLAGAARMQARAAGALPPVRPLPPLPPAPPRAARGFLGVDPAAETLAPPTRMQKLKANAQYWAMRAQTSPYTEVLADHADDILEMLSKLGSTEKTAEVEYRGHTFPGYNQPVRAGEGQHKMMVLAKKGDDVRLVRFGHRGYEHNYSPEAKANYLKRSAGIRDGSGNLTKDDKFSANYWARKHLWPRNQEADGSALRKEAADENYRHRATLLLRNKRGELLASLPNQRAASSTGFTSVHFPGGGVHEDERFDMPTTEQIVAAARREALEELGVELKNPQHIHSIRNPMDQRFRDRQTAKRGIPIHGLHEHYVMADLGRANKKHFGSEGDVFRGRYSPVDDILFHMDRDARGISEGASTAAQEAALLRKHLSEKRASADKPHDAVEVDGKYYRPKVQTFMYDKRGRILASKSQAAGSGLRAFANYKFPGGGIEPNEDVLEAAKKELLEEAGYEPAGDMFEFGKRTPVDWDPSFREQAAKKGRGAYHGQYEYYVAGPLGKRDTSRFGSEGDAMTGLELVNRNRLRKALTQTANDPKNEYGYFDKQKLVALGELEKQLVARNIVKQRNASQR